MTRFTNEERQRHEVFRELEELSSEMNYNVDAVVVEGPHDKKTLRILGFRKPVLTCQRLSKSELVDLVAKKFSKVVVLTDFDEEGTFLNKKLSQLLERREVKVDPFYRRTFQRLLKQAKVSTIEGVYSIKLDLFS